MPAAPIPFDDGQASGIEELAGASPAVINVTHDPSGTTKTRPALSAWEQFPAVVPDVSGVTGIWIFGTSVIYTTADRKIWALLAAGLVIPLSDTTAATKLDGTSRPVAVVTRTRIVIIGGGVPQKWEGTGLSSRLGGSPPAGTSIVAIAQRLVISDNSNTGLIFWSEPGELAGHEDWRGDMASAEAESRPDALVNLGTAVGEIFAFGTETTQIFLPDPDGVFIPGATAEVGTLAAGSVIKYDTMYAFLDDRRRIVATDGRSFQEWSTPSMSQTLWRFATVSDCWAFRARFDSCDLIGFVFPTEGRACIYNAAVKKWTEWRSLDSDGRWAPWAGLCHCYWPAQGLHLIGMPDGTIAKLDPFAFSDNGQLLKATIRTGFISRDTGNRKICERVQLTMRRGSTSSALSAPVAQLRWRDDLGAFGPPLTISLGVAGDVEAQVQLWTLGVYNTRQWELSMSDPSEFVLVSAEETFTPLEA